MKRKFFLLLFLFLCSSSAVWSQVLLRPLAYTHPDSVSLEDMFWSRAYGEVWESDSLLRARPVSLRQKDAKSYGKWQSKWHKLLSEDFSLWGGTRNKPYTDYAHQVNASITMLDLSARLFLLTGRACYAETMERCLYNGIRVGTMPSLPSSLRREAAHRLLNVKGLAYASQGADVYVNLYVRSKAYVRTDSLDVVILQNTSSPWQLDTFFAFNFNRPQNHMRLHLRLPGWLRGEVMPENGRYRYRPMREFYQVSVNGVPTSVRAKDGYIVIDRVWKSDDVVTLKATTPVRRIEKADPASLNGNTVALQFGPLLYVAEKRVADSLFLNPNDAIGYAFDLNHRHAEILKGTLSCAWNAETQDSLKKVPFAAIPYYVAAFEKSDSCQLWIPTSAASKK